MKTPTAPVRRENDILIVYEWATGASIKLRGTATQFETVKGPLHSLPASAPAAAKRISILLADDHRMIREGLRKMLELEKDLVVVGEAQNGRQAVLKARDLRPDVILMDIAMPQLNGLEAAQRVIKVHPEARVLILSAHRDDAYIKGAVESGAVGYLLKQTSSHVVCRAIRDVQMGKTFFCPSVSRRLGYLKEQSPDHSEKIKRSLARLSSRGQRLLRLVAQGCANKQIAEELSLNVTTIERHRENLMEDLDIHDADGLRQYAVFAGLIGGTIDGDGARDMEEEI